MAGDSNSFTGNASGAGDDIINAGTGIDDLRGDSQGPSNVSGDGGDDTLDLGPDGGAFAIGDHNTFNAGSTATGAGNDRITGGSTSEPFLIGDSSADNVTDAGSDVIEGRNGNDTLFGDNVDVEATGTVGTAGGADVLFGGNGGDVLRAGPVNDLLNGGPQSDDCDGEAGNGDVAVQCETVNGIP